MIFKQGQRVRCIPFEVKSSYNDDMKRGGSGYKLGKVFTLKSSEKLLNRYTNESKDDIFILWPINSGCGVYSFAVELLKLDIDSFKEEF